jgi:hypothetical protein
MVDCSWTVILGAKYLYSILSFIYSYEQTSEGVMEYL